MKLKRPDWRPIPPSSASFGFQFVLIIAGFIASKAVIGERTHSLHCQSTNEPVGVPRCQHYLNERYGHFSTPNFPSAFPVPFICSWIINATAYEPDSFITLYLTQMYLTRGAQVVQYSFHNGTHATGKKDLDEIHILRSRPFSVYRIKARFLEVQVNLHDLLNANLRVEERLMDVYGFNITYEIQPNNSKIRSDSCNAVNCTFNGHCYASKNYSQFQCSCLPGFSGKFCQYGPDCDPRRGINVCKNGGICGYRYGLTVVRCNCPPHYNGSLCEYRREAIPSKECLSRFKLNCSHYCVMMNDSAACRCPVGHALKSDNITCYPLLPRRVMSELTITPPRGLNRIQLLHVIDHELRSQVRKYSAELLTVGDVTLDALASSVKFQLWSSEQMMHNKAVWSSSHHLQNQTFQRMRLGDSKSSDYNSSPSSMKRMSRDAFSNTEDKQWPSAVKTTLNFFRELGSPDYELGNTGVIVNKSTFLEVPALVIEWIQLDVVNGRVREGNPFTVACKTSGSERLVVRWLKDGYPIEPENSLRQMHVYSHAPDLQGYYTTYLEIKKATLRDRGQYECEISDWEQTVQKSIFLDVITRPILNLTPAHPSVREGTDVILTCRDENDLARRTITKYQWKKNRIPIQSSCDEIIEDLFPMGTSLKVSSIQHHLQLPRS